MLCFYRYYDWFIVSIVTILSLIHVGLPITAALMESYSQIILISAILQTIGLLLPFCEYILIYHFTEDDEYNCSSLIMLLWLFLFG